MGELELGVEYCGHTMEILTSHKVQSLHPGSRRAVHKLHGVTEDVPALAWGEPDLDLARQVRNQVGSDRSGLVLGKWVQTIRDDLAQVRPRPDAILYQPERPFLRTVAEDVPAH